MSVASADVDPVTYQILVSRLAGIVREMQENIFRTGYSTTAILNKLQAA